MTSKESFLIMNRYDICIWTTEQNSSQADLDTKQDKLTAGTNITIDLTTNTISASGGVSQADLDTKQNKLTAGDGFLLY